MRKDPDMLLVERQGAFTAGLIPLSPLYMPLADGAAEFSLGAGARATELNLRFAGEYHRARRNPATPAGATGANPGHLRQNGA